MANTQTNEIHYPASRNNHTESRNSNYSRQSDEILNEVDRVLTNHITLNGTTVHGNKYGPVKERLTRMGWYAPDTTLKQRMFLRGKYLNCYVCDETISFKQVGASRTIPRNMMSNYNPITGEEPPKTLENIYVLCMKCVMDDVIVDAPNVSVCPVVALFFACATLSA